MKCKINSTEYWNNHQKLLEKYPCLSNYKFEVEETGEPARARIHDENGMPYWQEFTRITRTAYIHVDTVEELVQLANETNNELVNGLIIGKDGSIEIYDTYRE